MLARQQICDFVIEGLPVALFVVDREYKIIEFNAAAQDITGLERASVLGRQCADVFGSNLCRNNCPLRESSATGLPCLGRKALIQPEGKADLPILFSSRALLDERGAFVCGVEVFRDATEVVNLETHKRNLVSLFAHDLKSPVATTGGFVERLLQGKAGELNEKQTRYLQTVQKEIHRLEQYIFSFLDIARIESGQLVLQTSPCDMEELLQEIVTAFEVQASEKKIALRLEIESLPGRLTVDRLQISRVISNLLDNAIKYSPDKSVIRIRAHEQENRLILEIVDQGPGINPGDQSHIFNHFYRINDERRGVKGTGLGLAAVKAIVEAHGGRVWLESTPGTGSAFFVALPKQCRLTAEEP